MPATGAAFAIILITIFAFRLTLGEEAFLKAQLGEPYLAYLRAVPRFMPRFRECTGTHRREAALAARLLAELTPVGVLVAIAVYARDYDLELAGRMILVFFGASLWCALDAGARSARACTVASRFPNRPRCVKPNPSEYFSP